MKLFKLFSLLLLATFGNCNLNEDNPSIQSCVYTDAHWLECWWEEPKDTDVKYSLGYLKDSDPIEMRPIYMCTDEEPKHDLPPASSGMRMRSCALLAHMYSTYQMYLVTDECHEGDYKCHNTSSLSFECNPNFVYLLSPPSHVEINEQLMVLNWRAPDRPGTMLSFALLDRKVRYQVSYRMIGFNQEWDAFYEGYQTQVSLPPIKPSSNYEVKIEAKLDPPDGYFLHEVNVHEWGSPEVRTNFTSPSAAVHVQQTDDGLDEEDIAVTHHDQLNYKVLVTAISLSLCVSILATIVFLLFYCKCVSCKKERKIGKPLLFVDFNKQSFEHAQQNYGANMREQNEEVEKFAPISSLVRLHPNGSLSASQEHRLQDSLSTSSFVANNEDNNETNFQPRHRAELFPTILNDSISINEELSEADDSMGDSYVKQSSMPLYQTEREYTSNEFSSNAASGSSHQAYIDTNASAVSSPYSIPSYIWGPGNSGYAAYTTSPSVSSYVFGSKITDDIKLKTKITTPQPTSVLNEKTHSKIAGKPSVTSPRPGSKNVIQAILSKVASDTPVSENKEMVVLVTCPVCHGQNCCKYSKTCEVDDDVAESAANSRRNSFSERSVDSGYSPDSLDAATTV